MPCRLVPKHSRTFTEPCKETNLAFFSSLFASIRATPCFSCHLLLFPFRDINKVDDTMDSIREQMDLATEISDAISAPLGGEGVDDVNPFPFFLSFFFFLFSSFFFFLLPPSFFLLLFLLSYLLTSLLVALLFLYFF